jgi:hypothetical protein
MKKKRILVITACTLILLSGLFVIWKFWSTNEYKSYLSPITQTDIPQALRIKNQLFLPNDMDIVSIQKYDDGFTSPSVTIHYKNDIVLNLYTSWVSYRDMELDNTKIGEHHVEWYRSDKKQVYVIKFNDINYAFEFHPNNKVVVEDYMKSLK